MIPLKTADPHADGRSDGRQTTPSLVTSKDRTWKGHWMNGSGVSRETFLTTGMASLRLTMPPGGAVMFHVKHSIRRVGRRHVSRGTNDPGYGAQGCFTWNIPWGGRANRVFGVEKLCTVFVWIGWVNGAIEAGGVDETGGAGEAFTDGGVTLTNGPPPTPPW